MADDIKKVERYSIDVANEPGEGVRVLQALADAKINLLACWGYPAESGARIELIPEDGAALRTAARAAKLKVKKESMAFCVMGRNKAGALAGVLAKLAAQKINVHAVQALAIGNKYGALVQVDAKAARKAAAALGV